jgi:FkbM family methyltransferase
MTNAVYRAMFWSMAYAGRRFGGIRPRRITYWLQRKAFTRETFSPTEARWWTDRWGSELLMNPHYLLDACVIAFGAFDPGLHEYVERHVTPGMTCFDVGANIGAVAVHLARKVGPSGQVHAFEPVPAVRERLVQHVRRNHGEEVVRIHPVALSNQSGSASIAVADSEATNQGQASLVNRSNPELRNTIEVPTITVDEFVAQNAIGRIDVMKIDIQGAEIFLLEGGRKVFGEMGPDLLMEVSPEDLACLGKDSRDLLTMVEGYGYRLYELKGATPGRRVAAGDVAPDYYCDNILCTKREVGR